MSSSRVNEFAIDGQRFLVHVLPNDAVPTVNVLTNREKAALRNK